MKNFLLAAGLLLTLGALSGCLRQEIVTAAVPNFHCQLDGQPVVYKAYAHFIPSPANTYPDLMDIESDTAGTSTSMCVRFAKPAGSDASKYKLVFIQKLEAHKQYTCSENLTGRLIKTAAGGWSGTFAGRGDASPRTDEPLHYADFVPAAITEGVFTEVQP